MKVEMTEQEYNDYLEYKTDLSARLLDHMIEKNMDNDTMENFLSYPQASFTERMPS